MQNEENKKIVFGKYCFRIAPDGHFDEDTQENRDELLKTAASEYLIGTDQYGLRWCARDDEGYELWATVQENAFVNGGVHVTPRILNYDFTNEHGTEIEIEPGTSDNEKVSTLQAFYICYLFLEKQWTKSHNKELAWMLSGLALLKNGLEIDPKFHRNFEECIQDVLQITSLDDSPLLTPKEVFQVMCKFLKMKIPNDPGCTELLALLDYDSGIPYDPELKNEWIQCCEMVEKRLINKNHFFFKLKH